MNEQACAFVCAIFSAVCAGLFWAAAKYDDHGAMIIGMVFSIVVTLLSGYVMICRYL